MGLFDEIFDVVIIGSGMGGLACANILSKHGKKVIVLEKNRQIGGNLQIFSRDGCVFDTGVHYLGGLDEGQILNRLFKYFGIYDELKLKRMDENGFDRIHFLKENVYYHYGIGYENFRKKLLEHFPEEHNAIDQYCVAIRDVVQKLPLAQLKLSEDDSLIQVDFNQNAKQFINSLTNNKQLQKVLAGNIALYAGSERTPFYVHALVLNYYIESSWRCVDGAAQIAKLMGKRIKEHEGVIQNRTEVKTANFNNDGSINSVVLSNGKVIQGHNFISNLHPGVTIDLFGKEHFKPAYVNRIQNLRNTGGMFVLHIVFQENTFEYINYNIFQIDNEDVWDLTYTEESWPTFYMISITPNSSNPKYAKGLSVICGMDWKEVEKWENTFNNVTAQKTRGEDYENFKRSKSEKIIDSITFHFPDIRQKIKSYSSSSPLTQRDYTASPEGSGYGIEKDSNSAYKTLVNTKTSIPNLYLTGQNLTLHGILGVSLSALLTCFNLVDKQSILKGIQDQS